MITQFKRYWMIKDNHYIFYLVSACHFAKLLTVDVKKSFPLTKKNCLLTCSLQYPIFFLFVLLSPLIFVNLKFLY